MGCRTITYFDVFSSPLGLHYNGEVRLSSSRTRAFTVLLLIWFVVFTVLFWLHEAKKTRIFSSSSILYDNPMHENFQNTVARFIIAVGIENQQDTRNLNDPGYFNLYASASIETNLDSSLSTRRTQSVLLSLVTCASIASNLDGSIYEPISNLESGYYCLDITNILESLFQKASDLHRIQITASRCDTSEYACYDDADISEFQDIGQLVIYFPRFAPPSKGERIQALLQKQAYPLSEYEYAGFTLHQQQLMGVDSSLVSSWLNMKETLSIQQTQDDDLFGSITLYFDSRESTIYQPETIPISRYIQGVTISIWILCVIFQFLNRINPGLSSLVDEIKLDQQASKPTEVHLLLRLLEKAKKKIAMTIKDTPYAAGPNKLNDNNGNTHNNNQHVGALPEMNTDNFYESQFQSPFSQQNMSHLSNNVNFTPNYANFDINSFLKPKSPQAPSIQEMDLKMSPRRQTKVSMRLTSSHVRFNQKSEMTFLHRHRSQSSKLNNYNNIPSATSLQNRSVSGSKQIAGQIPSVTFTPSMQSISISTPQILRPLQSTPVLQSVYHHHYPQQMDQQENFQFKSEEEEEQLPSLTSPLSSPLYQGNNPLLFTNQPTHLQSQEVILETKENKYDQEVDGEQEQSKQAQNSAIRKEVSDNQTHQFTQLLRNKRASLFAIEHRHRDNSMNKYSLGNIYDSRKQLPRDNEQEEEDEKSQQKQTQQEDQKQKQQQQPPKSEVACEKDPEHSSKRRMSLSQLDLSYFSALEKSHSSALRTSSVVKLVGRQKRTPLLNRLSAFSKLTKLSSLLAHCTEPKGLADELNVEKIRNTINEFDRLKSIIFNSNQRALFEYTIHSLINNKKIDSQMSPSQSQPAWSASSSGSIDLQKTIITGWKAIQAIERQSEMSDIDNRLMEYVNVNISCLVNSSNLDQEVDPSLTLPSTPIPHSQQQQQLQPAIQHLRSPIDVNKSDHEFTQSLALASRARRRANVLEKQHSGLSESSSLKIIGDENLP